MTPFTDDNLNRLKESREYDRNNRQVVGSYSIPSLELDALLARLEAAEACLSDKPHGHTHMPTIPQWEAWRKAAEEMK